MIKGKSIENYQLETLKYVNQHLSEIWLGRHKILKKNYMIKRIKFETKIDYNGQIISDEDERIALNANKITKEVEVLKKLKLHSTPKCQKIIKTNNNVYLIFDQFQGKSLAEYFKSLAYQKSNEGSDSFSTQSLQSECLHILLTLTKSLLNLHKIGLIMLLLSAENIFIKENKSILFTQWSSVVQNGDSSLIFPLSLSKGEDLIPNQVLSEQRCSQASDVFSLGKIFESLLQDYQFKDLLAKMRTIIDKMIHRRDSLRPSLNDVITQLLEIEKDLQMRVKSSKLTRTTSTGIIYNTQRTLSQQRKRNLINNDFRSRSKTKAMSLKKNSNSSRVSSPIDSSLTLNMSVNSKLRKSNDSFAKKINKIRNLSFLLMELSSFAMNWEKGEEMGYVLMKQSYIMLNGCYLDWSREDFEDEKNQVMKTLLKKEIIQHSLTLNMLKEYLKSKNISQQLALQLKNDASLNAKFVKECTAQFGRTVISEYNAMVAESKVENINNLIDELFATYIILKVIEEGSYERYWNKVYDNDSAFLKNQSHFKEEKKLGYRYLRSKIEETLKNI